MSSSEDEDSKKLEDKKKSDEVILKRAKERFRLASEAESANRKEELDDLRFMVGDQWPLNVVQERKSDNRPCLTINRIPQFVRQITNDQRQNRPAIKVNSVDDQSDSETAKIFQGIIRHIEYNSHADIAYDTAFEAAVKNGLGYFRLVTEYSDPMSFQQEIIIKRIKDRLSVYLDHLSQEPDGSDAIWGIIFEEMSRDEYDALYPKSEAASMSDWDSLGNISDQWLKKDGVRIAEYYEKIFEEVEIVQLNDEDRTVIPKSQLTEDLQNLVVATRKTLVPKIKWYKINGLEILEETEVPGEFIPIIPVIGEEQLIEGKRILSGIIRHAKDPQRMYNYWASAETETIALAPRAPFIGVEGQFEGFEDKWKTANTRNHAFLEYKAKSIGGQPAPPPQRNMVEPQVQAITQARAQSAEDLKATTGIYDATLGNRSNEQSGVAIQRRNIQAQTSNFHFIDNLSRSLRHAGRILVSWIPKVYDTPQVIRVIGDDGEVDMVKINQAFSEGGKDKSHFLDAGRYDVTVDTGPSFQTKRQESVASMLDLLRSAPQLMSVSGDLLVRNMDWPGAQEIADRIKKTLPPNITDDGKDGKQPLPPQIQQQIMQQSQMIKLLSKELEENSEIIRTKRMELESRERIEMFKAQTDLNVEVMKHDAKDSQIAFLEEVKMIHKRLDLLNTNQPIGNDSGGEPPAANPNFQQQPTGGLSPGQPMGG